MDKPVTRATYRDHYLPLIFVDRPAWGAALRSPGRVTGLANVDEAQFRMALLDRNDKVLVDVPVWLAAARVLGTFDVTLSYDVSSAQWGTLRVWDISEYSGRPVAVREYPVYLRPALKRGRGCWRRRSSRGAPGRTRTADAGLRTASLCPLSYGGADSIVPRRAGDITPGRTSRGHGRRSSLRRPVPPKGCGRSPSLQSRPNGRHSPPRPVLYGRPGCHLCDDARERADRPPGRAGPRRPRPSDPRRARHRDRSGLASAPTSRRSRSSSSATAGSSSRRALASSAGSWPTSWTPDRRPMAGTDLTILVALAAGVISFLSPCVLPLVPAYSAS